MNRYFTACAATGLLVLSACGRNETASDSSTPADSPPATSPSAAPAAPAASPAPTAASVPTSPTPLPSYPEWATSLISKDTAQGFTKGGACLGAFDVVSMKHTGSPSGVEVMGWGWLSAKKAAPTKIVFVNAAGVIVGAGTTVADRPDVKAAVPGVTVLKTGWHGEIGQPSGDITAMALTPGDTLCALGAPKTL